MSVVSDEAHPAIARRLFDPGFAPGAEVQMLRRAPLVDRSGDPDDEGGA